MVAFEKTPTLCSVYYPRHTGTIFLKTLVLKFSSSGGDEANFFGSAVHPSALSQNHVALSPNCFYNGPMQ